MNNTSVNNNSLFNSNLDNKNNNSTNDFNKIKCPSCGELIEPSQAFKHQFEDKIKQQYQGAFEQQKKQFENQFNEQKNLLIKKALDEQQQKTSLEMQDLKSQIQEKSKQVQSMREQELKLREEKRLIEEEKSNLKLEVQRQIDEERKKITEMAMQKAQEESRFKVMEKDKIISDLNKALEDANRKAQLGSQQLQGEVLELDFEESLRNKFLSDTISPVEKGVKGADVKQIVKSKNGTECGTILWETKRTKAWSEGWIEKLKADLRNEKANVPVIVTSTLPNDTKEPISLRNGVYVTTFATAIPLAILIRKNLIDIAYQKLVSAHRGKKADHLYEYITGHTFKQQLEAMVDSYFKLKNQITKERIAYEKMWKERDAQVDKLLLSTANIVGSIQGEVGGNVLQVKGLDLPQIESEDN